MKCSKAIIQLVLILCHINYALAADPWTLPQGQGGVTALYLFETFDTFYRGKERRALPFRELDQHTTSLLFTYGVSDDLTLDVSLGYTETHGDIRGQEGGINDSRLALRHRLLNEFDQIESILPTLTLSTALIVPGNYDETGFPIAPGDGAFGFESSILAGKVFGQSGFALSGELGWRLREGAVPEDFFTRAAVMYTVMDSLTTSITYYHDQALGGVELSDNNFNPQIAPQLKQISDIIEFGIGYTHSSEVYLGLFYAITLDGRNTGDKDIAGFAISYPF